MSILKFEGADVLLYPIIDIPFDMVQDLVDCGSPGQDASEAVDYVLSQHTIEVSEEDARSYLKPYGAWEDSELEDHDTNVERLVWLAGCDLRESDYIHFSGY